MIDEIQWKFDWFIDMGLLESALINFGEDYFDDSYLEYVYDLAVE